MTKIQIERDHALRTIAFVSDDTIGIIRDQKNSMAFKKVTRVEVTDALADFIIDSGYGIYKYPPILAE